MKRRWVRYLVTGLVLASIAGFGAFSTFLFNPFEGGYEYDLSSLIPREVDFYVAKSDLRDDFDPFPTPAFYEDLRKTTSGEALLNLPAVTGLSEDLDVAGTMAGLQESLDQLPVRIDVLEVFGGEDVAVSGFFRGPDRVDWAVYGHVNWMGKLGVELLRYPGLLGLEGRGLTVEEGEGFLQLSGQGLGQTIYLSRIKDVLVASSTAELVTDAVALEGVRGENSFGQSAKYADYIALLDREGNEFEVFVDYNTLGENQSWPKDRPNAYSENIGLAMAGRLFQAGFVRDLMGIVGFSGGVSLRLTALVSSETMNAVQKRFYRRRGFDKARALEVAKLAPADAGLFSYVHGDLGDLLREALSATPEGDVELLDDRVRAVWDYADATLLIDDLDTAFKDRAALVLRNNDFPDEGEAGPPHDDTTVPAWALILWVDSREKLDFLCDRVVARQGELAIKGREPGSGGVFVNTVQGGYKVTEYWSEFVPGTGHIATVDLADYFVISNSHQMLGRMVKTYFDGGPAYPRLADDGYFKSLVNTGLAKGNALAWLNPRAFGETARALVDEMVRDSVFLDLASERPRIEREVLAEKFPGERYGSVSPGVQQQLDLLVDDAIDAYQAEIRGREVPRLRADWLRRLQALELTTGTLIEVSVDQKRFDLFARSLIPLEEPEP